MSTLIIKMLSEQRASMDGFHTRVFHKDEVLQVGNGEKDITDTLARRFIARGCATEIESNQTIATPSGAFINV